MEFLLNALAPVVQESLRLLINMVAIIESIMAEIVTDCSDDDCELFERAEPKLDR